jgi:hypothetical protein
LGRFDLPQKNKPVQITDTSIPTRTLKKKKHTISLQLAKFLKITQHKLLIMSNANSHCKKTVFVLISITPPVFQRIIKFQSKLTAVKTFFVFIYLSDSFLFFRE